jgi:hypothetical protein
VNLDSLSMKGGDGVGVEPKVWGVSGVTDGGVGLRPRRRCGAMAIRVVRATPMARSHSKAKIVARSRSWEAATAAWMVAMAATNAGEAGGGADVVATRLVQEGSVWVRKPGGELRVCCTVRAARRTPGRGSTPTMKGARPRRVRVYGRGRA